MASPSPAEQLESLLKEAGCAAETIGYIKARGYTHTSLLNKAGVDDKAVLDRLVTPFITGWTDPADGKVHKAGSPDIAEATILVACEDARVRRALATSAPLQLGGGAPLASPQPAPPGTAVVPKQIDPGDVSKLKDAWETAVSPRRAFPMRLLEGADQTIARLHHEWTVSRLFTPLPLAEIIKARAYNTDGSVNMRGVQPHRDALFKLDGGTLRVEERDASLDYLEGDRWVLWDAAEANAFALKLCGYGPDEAIDRLSVWLQRLIRNFSVSPRTFN